MDSAELCSEPLQYTTGSQYSLEKFNISISSGIVFNVAIKAKTGETLSSLSYSDHAPAKSGQTVLAIFPTGSGLEGVTRLYPCERVRHRALIMLMTNALCFCAAVAANAARAPHSGTAGCRLAARLPAPSVQHQLLMKPSAARRDCRRRAELAAARQKRHRATETLQPPTEPGKTP